MISCLIHDQSRDPLVARLVELVLEDEGLPPLGVLRPHAEAIYGRGTAGRRFLHFTMQMMPPVQPPATPVPVIFGGREVFYFSAASLAVYPAIEASMRITMPCVDSTIGIMTWFLYRSAIHGEPCQWDELRRLWTLLNSVEPTLGLQK